MGSECQSRKIAGNVSAPVDVCVCVFVRLCMRVGFPDKELEAVRWRVSNIGMLIGAWYVCVCARVCGDRG